MPERKQIPALPAATEANDGDFLIKRDVGSGTDERLSVQLFREEVVDPVVDVHAAETGEVHGIPEGERALHTGDGVALDGDQWDFDQMPEVDGAQLIATGSNDDGSWLLFSTGSLIQRSVNLTCSNTVVEGDSGVSRGNASGRVTWTFPLAYAGVRIGVGVNKIESGSDWDSFVDAGDVGPESLQISAYNINGDDVSLLVRAMSWGLVGE